MSREKEISYLKDHLESKSELTTEELDSYILYDLYLKHPNKVKSEQLENRVESTVLSEFNDILPKLAEYEYAKEQHFKGVKNIDLVEITKEMLKEIIEFLTTVYTNCDTIDERELVKKAFKVISNIE